MPKPAKHSPPCPQISNPSRGAGLSSSSDLRCPASEDGLGTGTEPRLKPNALRHEARLCLPGFSSTKLLSPPTLCPSQEHAGRATVLFSSREWFLSINDRYVFGGLLNSSLPLFPAKPHFLQSQPALAFPPQILEQLSQSLSSSQHLHAARRRAILLSDLQMAKHLTKWPVPKSQLIDEEIEPRRAKWLRVTQEGMQHQDTLVSHLPDQR